ncbi:hypothetical protein Slala03_54670 [Streptomyces lavendulae subsp. lavendulae]|nr:hypothetical protein [Streptomyces sp. SPB4]GLV85778.1 hypothetical protein Slala03_54670 [Streptomyces lavendulae subsp. lavendulae]GLW02767.1 hypothetical protein Slala05_63970 [Streptomyces lavendulae subsp. lavendulae]GLX37559.1 hypothetical protein Sros01_36320 [Streptomyces roseochromogenus]
MQKDIIHGDPLEGDEESRKPGVGVVIYFRSSEEMEEEEK